MTPVKDGYESMWKDLVVAYFNILFQHLPGRAEENHDKSQLQLKVHGRRYAPTHRI